LTVGDAFLQNQIELVRRRLKAPVHHIHERRSTRADSALRPRSELDFASGFFIDIPIGIDERLSFLLLFDPASADATIERSRRSAASSIPREPSAPAMAQRRPGARVERTRAGHGLSIPRRTKRPPSAPTPPRNRRGREASRHAPRRRRDLKIEMSAKKVS